MNIRTVSGLHNSDKPNLQPPSFDNQDQEQQFELRKVKIIDAEVVENEGSEENPHVSKVLWLLLEDMENGAIYKAPLKSNDIQLITGLSRPLQGREIYNFADFLKNREQPINLMVDPNNEKVTTNMILGDWMNEIESKSLESNEISLNDPIKSKQITRFKFNKNK